MFKRHEIYQYVNSISKGLFTLYYTFYIIHEINDLDHRAIAFAFLSISGVSIIFDLGLSQIFIKSSTSTENKIFTKKAIFAWFLISAIFSALTGIAIGFYVLSKYDTNIWLTPFFALIFSLISSILFSGYVLSVEADGKVAESYKIKMISSLILLSSVGFSYFISFKLYLLAFAFGLSTIWGLFKKKIFLIDFSTLKIFLGRNLIFIRQSSLVWISGFLFWNFPILITTKLYPSNISSTFALTFNILNSINFFSLSIFSSNRAIFSKLISDKLINEALALLKSKLFQIFGLFILGQLTLSLVIFLRFDFALKYTRILNFMDQYIILTILFSFLLLLQIIAVFMRSSGKESFYKELIVINLITPVVFCLGFAGFGINAILIIWTSLVLLITCICFFKFKKLVKLMFYK